MIEQKGMTIDHDFGYFFPLFFSLLKQRGKKKRGKNRKILIKSHAFLLDQIEVKRQKFFKFLFIYTRILLFLQNYKMFCDISTNFENRIEVKTILITTGWSKKVFESIQRKCGCEILKYFFDGVFLSIYSHLFLFFSIFYFR